MSLGELLLLPVPHLGTRATKKAKILRSPPLPATALLPGMPELPLSLQNAQGVVNPATGLLWSLHDEGPPPDWHGPHIHGQCSR